MLYELYRDLPRQGPGDNESTRRAFMSIGSTGQDLKLLDVGCGSGVHTIELAKRVNGHIVAIDIHEPYLNRLRYNAEREGLSDKISVLNKSMFDMDFADGSFNVIWSEGSVHMYGFRKALEDWKRLLTSPGHFVCSHVSWLSDDRPDEVNDFWTREYPEISTVSENMASARQAGYEVLDHFTLPPESWWKEYYNPLKRRIDTIQQKFRHDQSVMRLAERTREEISMFKRSSDYYGYVFYIMMKRS